MGSPSVGGGEAAIYAVPNRPQLFAKVYHKPSGERAEKLAAMLAAPPDDPMAPTGHPSIAWPIARLLAPGVNLVVGYLMPRVEHGRLALEFYNPRMRQQLCPLFHYRYLVRTAHNLAVAVRALHERGYVVGDLNESNVLVTNQALIALVDTDSFQVHTPNRLFRCRVGKPEYTPPELQNARFTDIDRLPEHDAFGLAVLIFQFLMQGTHPFAGMHVGEGEAGTIPRRIATGHWPYAQAWEVSVKPSPHAPPWEVLPPSVQTLMRRCFEDGHPDPSARPQAIEWQRALLEAEEELKLCAANGQHYYHRGLTACPWCAMAQQHGRDPFPSLQEVRAKGKTTLKMESNGSTGDLTLPSGASSDAPPLPAKGAAESSGARLRRGVHATRERLQQLRTRMQAWPRSRLIATGAVGGAMVLLLVIGLFVLVPRVWSYLARAKPPEIVIPPEPPPPTFPREEPIAALKVCAGHTAKVNAVRFLPDGMRALSCGNDNTLRLWNLADGEEIRRFTGHTSWIMGLAVSADGRQALSASADKSLRAWDLTTGNEVHKLEGHANWVNAAALSANGQRGLSGGDDRSVRLWDLSGARLDFTFTGHTSDVTCVALSPDGKKGLSGAANGDLLLWDLERRRFIKKLEGHGQPIAGLAFTAEGRRAVSASRDVSTPTVPTSSTSGAWIVRPNLAC
jgi:serine/threonine protein kinase